AFPEWVLSDWVFSDRNSHYDAEPAERRGRERHVAAVAARHVARDGEAEAHAAGVDVPRFVEPEERPEHVLVLVGRNARAVVIDLDLDRGAAAAGMNLGLAAMAQGVGQEVGQATLDGERTELEVHVTLPVNSDVGIVAPRAGSDVLQDLAEVGRRRLLV